MFVYTEACQPVFTEGLIGSNPTCGAVIPKIKLKKRPLAKVALIFVRSTLRSWLL